MSYLIVNDVHLGAERSAGTTPETRRELKLWLQDEFRKLLESDETQKHSLIILGDLFDQFDVDSGDVLTAILTIEAWIERTGDFVWLVPGNHDLSTNTYKTGAFELMAMVLENHYPRNVKVVWSKDGLGTISIHDTPIYIAPHVPNQDLFNIHLEGLKDAKPGVVMVHANCMNPFAEQKDHSLNVDEETLDALLDQGHKVVFAHEHQKRTLKKGKVLVLGNQWPSSIADCLHGHTDGQKDNCKYAHILHDNGTIEELKTWQAKGSFVEMNWQELEPCDAQFIKVTGFATAERAAEVVSTVARYRQSSKAFVVSNAVSVASADGLTDLPELTSEQIKSIDVLTALCAELQPREVEAVKNLLAHR